MSVMNVELLQPKPGMSSITTSAAYAQPRRSSWLTML